MAGGDYNNGAYVNDGGGTDQNYNVNGKGNSGKEWSGGKQLTAEQIKKEQWSIMKNVCVISFAFMLLFTAFQSMANLQSSINKVIFYGKRASKEYYADWAQRRCRYDTCQDDADLILLQIDKQQSLQ